MFTVRLFLQDQALFEVSFADSWSRFFCFNDIFDIGRAEPSLHEKDKDKQIESMVWT